MSTLAPANGNLVGTIDNPLRETTFVGTSSSVDYVLLKGSGSYPSFTEFVQRGNNLVFTTIDPALNTEGQYTLPLLGSSTAIEYMSREAGTSTANGPYKLAGPGDYRTNNTDTGLQAFGTNANDTIYGLVGQSQANALYGGPGNDMLVGGNNRFSLFNGGSGTNELISAGGTNRYRIDVADNGNNIIRGQGGNDIVQILLPTISFDWSFKRTGNDLTGSVTDVEGNTTRFTIENQYTTGRVDSILLYVDGQSPTGAVYRGMGLNDPGIGSYTGTAQLFVSTSSDTVFDLRDTTRTVTRVFGNEGNDTFFAGPAGTINTFYAGDGIDTFVVTGALADYTLSLGSAVQGASGRQINFANLGQPNKTNPDYLQNVERLQFSDTMVALDIAPNQTAGKVYMLYQATFNRTPDTEGLGYWIKQVDNGANITTDVAAFFVTSPEFVAKYGANPSVASYVDNLYLNVLGRPGEAGGVAYWNQELSAGRITRAAVLEAFATLPEGAALVADAIANGIQYQEWLGQRKYLNSFFIKSTIYKNRSKLSINSI